MLKGEQCIKASHADIDRQKQNKVKNNKDNKNLEY